MNKHSPIKQALDHELESLNWTEANANAVRNAIQEKGNRTMKHKLTKTLLLAAVIFTMTLGSLAATGVIFSERTSQFLSADKILEEKYGLTASMLSYFTREERGDTVVYLPNQGFEYVLGQYTVVPGEKPAASWSWDGTEPSPDTSKAPWGEEALNVILSMMRETRNADAIHTMAQSLAAEAGADVAAADSATRMGRSIDEQIAARERQTTDTAILEEIGRAAVCAAYGITPEMQPHLVHIPENNGYAMVDGDKPCLTLFFPFAEITSDGQGPATDRFSEWTDWEGVYIVCVNVENGVVEYLCFESVVIGNG